jgi:hypothetical protein
MEGVKWWNARGVTAFEIARISAVSCACFNIIHVNGRGRVHLCCEDDPLEDGRVKLE